MLVLILVNSFLLRVILGLVKKMRRKANGALGHEVKKTRNNFFLFD